jgi:hypothetical protein
MRISLEWIDAVAELHPEWCFMIKDHHPADQIGQMLLESKLAMRENVLHIPFEDATIADVLRADSVIAVAAFSSTGLYLARGFGKHALRFCITGLEQKIPLVDEVSRSINNAAELHSFLSSVKYDQSRWEVNCAPMQSYPNGFSVIPAIADHIEKRLNC